MPGTDLYINSACTIAHHTVWLGRNQVFSQPGVNGADLLVAIYKNSGIEYPKFYKMDRLAQLGFLATELLLKGQEIAAKYQPEEVGLVFNNANASLDADIQYFETVKNIPSPAQFVYTLPNIVMGEVSIRHKLKGENAFFVSDGFNASLVEWYVRDLMARKKVNACVCGWIDYMENQYRAVLYLVERDKKTTSLIFDINNIQKIYELSDGEING